MATDRAPEGKVTQVGARLEEGGEGEREEKGIVNEIPWRSGIVASYLCCGTACAPSGMRCGRLLA